MESTQSQSQTQGGPASQPVQVQVAGGPVQVACGVVAYDELRLVESETRHPLLARSFGAIPDEELSKRQKAAEEELRERGVTFAVYGHGEGAEKVWPFDIVPRPILRDEWNRIEAGLKQRIRALNLFLDDVYGPKHILNDGTVPRELVIFGRLVPAAVRRAQAAGRSMDAHRWHRSGAAQRWRSLRAGRQLALPVGCVVRDGKSRADEARAARSFSRRSIAAIEDYPERLLNTLMQTAPADVAAPKVVLLTPGVFNSAYFEHTFLSQHMGIDLVLSTDLVVKDGRVWVKTTQGLERVDVIYRRIDDDFLDPECFRPDSVLGVPGLMEVYRNGGVTLANAPGAGIADDKAVYAYVPEIIKYYLKEDAILANVPTYLCGEPDQLEYVLTHLSELVVKPTNASGGYGITLGPRASKEELAKCAEDIRSDPRNYVAQPFLTLSTVPTVVNGHLAPRHVDLRPFILYGSDIFVLPGGLTRMALVEGSMIVNSSQGGGSKDTWVIDG